MQKPLIYSLILTTAFLWFGFILLHEDIIAYGVTFFIILPGILGYMLENSSMKSGSLWGIFLGLIVFFTILFMGNLEGLICIFMALPVILPSLLVGYLVALGVKSIKKNRDRKQNLKSSIVPALVILVLGVTEHQFTKNDKQIAEVRTEVILPYSPEEVYDAIKSVDTLDAEKPFLMKLDLPIPQKCILEDEKVGGIRTCYFEGGRIVERITELEKAKIIRMDVIDYELTGRKWLGFKEAIYLFDELPNGQCKMTRITTYTSELYPRVYWEPLEKWGIEQEHTYVISNLKKDLKATHSE